MIKNNLTLSEFLRVLKRNLGSDHFVFENRDHTLEYRTRKCRFKTFGLSTSSILLARRFCKEYNIEYLHWDPAHDDIEVLQ